MYPSENPNPTDIEFIAPFSLQQCHDRLKSRHEGWTLLSMRWQTRLAVKVQVIDDFTCKFRVCRVQKSSFWDWGAVGEASGYLRAQTANSTVVIGKAKINWGFMLFSTVLVLAITAIMLAGWWSDGIITAANLGLVILIALAINGLLNAFMYFYARSQASEAQNLVRRVLGDTTY